jgi:hypothetical protein
LQNLGSLPRRFHHKELEKTKTLDTLSRDPCSMDSREGHNKRGHHRHAFHPDTNHSHCSHLLTDKWKNHQLSAGTEQSATNNGISTGFLWEVPYPPAPPCKKHIECLQVIQGEPLFSYTTVQ